MYSVVILDDNKIAVTAIEKSTDWNRFGCKVIGTAYNGIAGLDLIYKECPDIAIVDIQMPGFNGLDVIEKINSRNQNIQFIIISGYSQFEYTQKAIRYGVSDFLLKPILTEELEQALEKTIDTIHKKEKAVSVNESDALEAKIYSIRLGKKNYSTMVSKAIDYVDRNIHCNISLTNISKELLVSTSYFSKCFKRETKIGFASYVSMVKMENARILLKNPQNRVNEVAHMLGYSDYTYFFQVFKKQFGYAPSDLKQYGK